MTYTRRTVLLMAVPISAVAGGCLIRPQNRADRRAASLKFSYHSGDDDVVVEHVGGDTFDQSNTETLSVVVDGERADELPLPFQPGDQHTVTVTEPFDTIEVYQNTPEGNEYLVDQYVHSD